MSEEPARGEGSSPARAGEAARQRIRRTRQVPRRNFPAEEKIRIVLEGIQGEVAVPTHLLLAVRSANQRQAGAVSRDAQGSR